MEEGHPTVQRHLAQGHLAVEMEVDFTRTYPFWRLRKGNETSIKLTHSRHQPRPATLIINSFRACC